MFGILGQQCLALDTIVANEEVEEGLEDEEDDKDAQGKEDNKESEEKN